MRAIFVAMLLALGIGLIGTSGSIAAPANGIAIGEAIGITDPVKVTNGYSIIRVDARTPAGEPVFDANKVREAITYERMPKEREAYLTKLRQEAYIEVSATYRDALLPLLKTEAPKAANATPAPVATATPDKNDKKKSYAKKP